MSGQLNKFQKGKKKSGKSKSKRQQRIRNMLQKPGKKNTRRQHSRDDRATRGGSRRPKIGKDQGREVKIVRVTYDTHSHATLL